MSRCSLFIRFDLCKLVHYRLFIRFDLWNLKDSKNRFNLCNLSRITPLNNFNLCTLYNCSPLNLINLSNLFFCMFLHRDGHRTWDGYRTWITWAVVVKYLIDCVLWDPLLYEQFDGPFPGIFVSMSFFWGLCIVTQSGPIQSFHLVLETCVWFSGSRTMENQKTGITLTDRLKRIFLPQVNMRGGCLTKGQVYLHSFPWGRKRLSIMNQKTES